MSANPLGCLPEATLQLSHSAAETETRQVAIEPTGNLRISRVEQLASEPRSSVVGQAVCCRRCGSKINLYVNAHGCNCRNCLAGDDDIDD